MTVTLVTTRLKTEKLVSCIRAGHERLSEAEACEQFLVDSRQQIAVGLRQLDLLHREVGVKVSDVGLRQLHRQQTID